MTEINSKLINLNKKIMKINQKIVDFNSEQIGVNKMWLKKMDLNSKTITKQILSKLKLSFTKRIETLQKTTKSNNIKIKQIYKKQKNSLLMYLITEKKYLIEGININK